MELNEKSYKHIWDYFESAKVNMLVKKSRYTLKREIVKLFSGGEDTDMLIESIDQCGNVKCIDLDSGYEFFFKNFDYYMVTLYVTGIYNEHGKLEYIVLEDREHSYKITKDIVKVE